MSLPLTNPPDNLCLLRLSAVGDICHALPVVRTIQKVWPNTRLTWVIGKLEYSLVGDIPGIEFIIFDKAAGFDAYWQLRKQMQDRHYDVLLHMQMSLRASLASRLIPADIRLGFDKQRANDFQWLFTNARIPYVPQQHVMDSFFEFIKILGIKERLLEWNIPIPEGAILKAGELLPPSPYVVISPCSSMSYRNWTVEGYAAIADYVADKHGLNVVITGGPTKVEYDYGNKIAQLTKSTPVNLVGQTTLKELLAILSQAKLVIAPDSGPAHMATAVSTPVIGLYATTNPDRARPYLSSNLVINQYEEAVYDKYNKHVDELPWGTRVKDAGTMARIEISEVASLLDQALQGTTSPV